MQDFEWNLQGQRGIIIHKDEELSQNKAGIQLLDQGKERI
jgi:hypothetical protein